MSQKNFNAWAGFIFLVVAVAHLWRIISQTSLLVGKATIVPMWISYIGVLLAGYLAYQGLKKRRS